MQPKPDGAKLSSDAGGATWNRMQTLAFNAAVVLFLTLGLFPPIVEERVQPGFDTLVGGKGDQVLESKFVGYGFLFTALGPLPGQQLGSAHIERNLAGSVLLVEWLVVSMGTGAAIWFFSDPRQSDADTDCDMGPRYSVRSIMATTTLRVGSLLTAAGTFAVCGGGLQRDSQGGIYCILLGVPLFLFGAGLKVSVSLSRRTS
jgi:hypothetical protein